MWLCDVWLKICGGINILGIKISKLNMAFFFFNFQFCVTMKSVKAERESEEEGREKKKYHTQQNGSYSEKKKKKPLGYNDSTFST